MGQRRVVSLGIVIVVVAVTLVAGAPGVAQQAQPESDNTITRIQVHPDGSATWTVRIRTRLPTSDSVTSFERFQQRFRSNTSQFLDPYRSGIQQTVAQAADATGRQMEAVNFSAETNIQTVPRRWGVVTYRFTWTDFAQQSDDRLVVGDVFQGGFRITQNDTLVVSAPSDGRIQNADPEPDRIDNGTVRWRGPRNFLSSRPRVVFDQSPAGTDVTPTPTDGTGPSSPTDPGTETQSGPGDDQNGDGGTGDGGDNGLLLAGMVVVTVVLALGVFAVWRRRDDSGTPTPSASDESDTADGTAGDASETGAEPAIQSTTTDPPAEPLTNEQQVKQLLEANGGQMRQADIVAEVDWSKSKTSRVLTSMADEGHVEKITLGRENVIRLPTDED
jgi:hypothetical protein